MLFEQEGFEVDDQLESLVGLLANSSILDQPVLVEETEFFLQQLLDLRVGGVVGELLNCVFDVGIGV